MGRTCKNIASLLIIIITMVNTVSGDQHIKNDTAKTVYKIQIRANYLKPLSADSISNLYKLDIPIDVYYHNKYYKYTIYEFTNLLHAIDTLFLAINNYHINDAFLVKFIDNKRTDFDSDHDYLKVLQKNLVEENAGIIDTNRDFGGDTSFIVEDTVQLGIYLDHGVIRPILIPQDNLADKWHSKTDLRRKSIISSLEKWLDSKLPDKVFRFVKYILLISYNQWILFLIMILILYFIVLSIVLMILVLTSRTWDAYFKRKRNRLKNNYHEIIADYLFKESNENIVPSILFKQGSRFRKNILIDVMLDLFNSLEGDIANKLRALYLNLRLERVSILKTKSRKWNMKVRGFQELSSIDAENAGKYIKRYLNSYNNELRSEAYIAFVRLNKDNPFGFLNLVDSYFTVWEQLKVHAIAVKYNVTIPDFGPWLKSKNDTVILFALRMIIIYKQQETANEIKTCLKHHNPQVRELAYTAIGELNLLDLQTDLLDSYSKETFKNRVTILNSLGRLPDEKLFSFYEKVIRECDDFRLRLNASLNLYHIGSPGQKLLFQIKEHMAPELDNIYLHVTDERI